MHHSVEDKTCEHCKCEMEVINYEKAYDELIYQPSTFYVRRHIVEAVKYPKAMMPGSFCSPEFPAHILR